MYMKKIDFKPILITIGLILFQSVIYLISKILEGDPHLIGNNIDLRIPFNVYAIIPYCIWYVMLFIVPYIIYKKDKSIFSKYCLTYIFMTLVANIIFVIYPTTVVRPPIEGNSIIDLIARFIFWIDTPILNCFPSLHCAISMLWILFTYNLKNTNIYFKLFVFIMSVTIMASTLILKQHVFIDLVSGDVIATVIYIVIMCENKLTKRFKELLKF